MAKLEWEKLFNEKRRKDLSRTSHKSMGTASNRTEIERDYDRVLFSAPVRRLADKTQVFPLDKNDSVRTRLTHSHEVANLARSIGVVLVYKNQDSIFAQCENIDLMKRNMPSLLATIGLAHDLGNPPFGHQGEKSIQQWFGKKNDVHSDFLGFNGNAQTLRLLTRLQIIDDEFGLNLTCASLAGLLKYPCFSSSENSPWVRKFGIFESERNIIEQVWDQTGLSEYLRHPMVFIMEACDDIAYSVIDAEDIVRKGYASFYDLIDHLDQSSDEVVKKVVDAAKEKNDDFKKLKLSSGELNDISMQMFRVKAISEMVDACVETYEDHMDQILSMEAGDFELIRSSKAAKLCAMLKKFDLHNGFLNKSVLELELKGHNYIQNTMSMIWRSIDMLDSHRKSNPFEAYVYGIISENYRRVFEQTEKSLYDKHQLLCDVISGMTDSYLIDVHDHLMELQ